MSLRYEQYRALKMTRDLLRDVLHWQGPITHKAIKDMAYRCLKHFPHLDEQGQPYWSNDELTEDRED